MPPIDNDLYKKKTKSMTKFRLPSKCSNYRVKWAEQRGFLRIVSIVVFIVHCLDVSFLLLRADNCREVRATTPNFMLNLVKKWCNSQRAGLFWELCVLVKASTTKKPCSLKSCWRCTRRVYLLTVVGTEPYGGGGSHPLISHHKNGNSVECRRETE